MLTPYSIKAPLLECGYRPDLLKGDFSFGDHQSASLVAFAQQPTDSRSACVAVLSEPDSPGLAVEACKPLGAPVVFVCYQGSLQWWKQGSNRAEHLQNVQASEIQSFFRTNQNQFSPEAVYRAKTWGRFQTDYQLSFVDLGLMPVVQEQAGAALGKLIERNVSGLKLHLGWDAVSSEQGQWLLQSVFWLLSAKILRDKQVESFGDLDLIDVEQVFRRVGKHYGTPPIAAGSKKKLEALAEAAQSIDRFSSLVLTTTESLAYVYENTLISKATRSALGTHSTPSFLVDYVVGNLAQWVSEIPVNNRSVFEPACGHAAFLVSAMRLLTDLLPADKAIPSRRGPYLRSRLHGTDIDPFALELARLSLTLTDIPNPDGWDLKAENMFLGERLATQAKRNTILLANPPFDNFTPQDKLEYSEKSAELRFTNKAAEMLWRTLPQLPEGGVFGVVLPRTILHSDDATDLRKVLVEGFELKEIALFPDKVFSFSDAESAVIIGRRKKADGNGSVIYRRIRERQLPSFRREPSSSASNSVLQGRFSDAPGFSLNLPELEEVWAALRKYPSLETFSSVGQGLSYRSRDLPAGTRTYEAERFSGGQPGFVVFDRALCTHQLPTRFWMNLDRDAVLYPRSGGRTSVAQVLLNYAPASRGPWRLKALIDRQGHPVTSNFIAVRPMADSVSLEVLWALLNGPIANAYAYSHLGKRHNIVGDIRKIPLPKQHVSAPLDLAVGAYWNALSNQMQTEDLERLLLRVDAEALKLYDLPLELEQQVLSLFTDWKRVGVSFTQTMYLPAALEGKVSFWQFLEMEGTWSAINRERGQLIDKNIAGTISTEERSRLEILQAYADYHLQKVSPRPTHMLDEIERQLGYKERRS